MLLFRALGCKAFIYRASLDRCWLKSAASDPKECDDCYGRNVFEKVRPMVFCLIHKIQRGRMLLDRYQAPPATLSMD